MTQFPFAAPPLPSPIPLTFQWPVKFCVVTTIVTYVLSLVTGNVSQVDRLWTYLPVTYSAYYALLPWWPSEAWSFPLFYPYTPEGIDRRLTSEGNPRTMLMLGLQLLWMIRLSYNTWRRGLLFDFHDEDYRWEVLRSKIPAWAFQIFNLTFIAIIQNILLFSLAIPTHNAAILPPSQRGLTTADYILAGLSVTVLALEFIADNQQHAFQTFKRTGVADPKSAWPGARLRWTNEDAQRGFITKGLWAWSRHPNFACEQLFWVLQAFFPILATETLPKLEAGEITPLFSLIPALALCALFMGSTLFTEYISLSKYPKAYKAYQRRVSMFMPFLTPAWGWVLQLQNQKDYCDRLVFGSGKKTE